MPAKHLILGFDAFDHDLVTRFGQRLLPTIHERMHAGCHAAQESVFPPATLPNWTSFLTGVNPGVHGVFDFVRKDGYDVAFNSGATRHVPLWVEDLDAQGKRCLVVGFPGTYPPPRLKNGWFVSGWDAPVAFSGDASFVSPPELHKDIHNRFGDQLFDELDQFHADAPDFLPKLEEHLIAKVEKQTALCSWLIDQRPWDVVLAYFGQADTACHFLWGQSDTESPRHDPVKHRSDGIVAVYAALDQACATLLSASARESKLDEVELTIVSDHGAGGSSDKVLYLNRLLQELGLLAFKKQPRRARTATLLKRAGFRILGSRARELVFRVGGNALANATESQARFGAIDFLRTYAYSDELNYFPGIYLNLRGRDPQGIIHRREHRAIREVVRQQLVAVTDPYTGNAVFSDVHVRESLFEGDALETAPDLIPELALNDGYSYNLMPSMVPDFMGGRIAPAPFRKLDRREYIGVKGRSLPGSHRKRGFYLGAGPSMRPRGKIQASILDSAATTYARLGTGLPTSFEGRVLYEGFRGASSKSNAQDRQTPSRTMHDKRPQAKDKRPEAAHVYARLKALGYVD